MGGFKDGLQRGALVTVICMLMHLNGKLPLVNAKDLFLSSYTLCMLECCRKYWISSDRISLFMWESKGIRRALYRLKTRSSLATLSV